MKRLLLSLLFLMGCSDSASTNPFPFPDAPCGVQLQAPIVYAETQGAGVTCSSPDADGFGAWADATGPLPLLRVTDAQKVSLLVKVDGQLVACADFTGSVVSHRDAKWWFDLRLSGCGVDLVGALYGDELLR